jgi:hypothetical protein
MLLSCLDVRCRVSDCQRSDVARRTNDCWWRSSPAVTVLEPETGSGHVAGCIIHSGTGSGQWVEQNSSVACQDFLLRGWAGKAIVHTGRHANCHANRHRRVTKTPDAHQALARLGSRGASCRDGSRDAFQACRDGSRDAFQACRDGSRDGCSVKFELWRCRGRQDEGRTSGAPDRLRRQTVGECGNAPTNRSATARHQIE